jgi:AcrR family transcriptional regulator
MPNLNSDSGKTATSTKRKADSVERLMDGAESVFAERGYHNANIHEICARANVGIGTFYAHFDHKRQLLQRVMRERALTVVDAIGVDDLPDTKRLEAKLHTIVDEPLSAGLWSAWYEAVHEHEDLREFHGEWRGRVLDELAELVKAARLRAGGAAASHYEPKVVAWTLMVMLRALAVHDRAGAPDLGVIARFSQSLIFGDGQIAAKGPRRTSARSGAKRS